MLDRLPSREQLVSAGWALAVLLMVGQAIYLLWPHQPTMIVMQPDPVLLQSDIEAELPVVVSADNASKQYYLVDPKTRSISKTSSIPSNTSQKPAALLGKININRATQAELERLPGIGPKMAQRIVEYRNQHGPFPSPQSLTNVPGIGPKTYVKLVEYITIN